jgi:thiamine biosynthesis protein ThiS
MNDDTSADSPAEAARRTARGGIEIRVNGKPRTVPGGQTLSELLDALELDRRAVVVELNRQIIRRNELDEIALEGGDVIELVHFVGGG